MVPTNFGDFWNGSSGRTFSSKGGTPIIAHRAGKPAIATQGSWSLSTLPFPSPTPHSSVITLRGQHHACNSQQVLWITAMHLSFGAMSKETYYDAGGQPVSKLLMSMVDGTKYLHSCDNRSILGNPYKLRSFRSPTIRPGCSAIIMLMFILSGDVELNPGPKNDTVYPCGFY